MYEPSSVGDVVAGLSLATTFPRSKTSSVSESPMSSSRSADTSKMANPLPAGLAHEFPDGGLRADVDATGGCAATSTDGDANISRPMTSFCWLPPERASAGTSGPGVRTWYSGDDRFVRGIAPARSIHGPLTNGDWV